MSDQQLEDLQDPDKEVDLSLSSKPDLTTLRKICERTRAQGGKTIVLAFDEFWSQYRPGQRGKPRQFLPDTDEYIRRVARMGETLREYGLGFELSLLSPLEIGRGYAHQTGETGRWVQYREGYRDPATGRYSVNLWEQHSWTNNKGTIHLKRTSVRVFAFREQRLEYGNYYLVDPGWVLELKTPPQLEVSQAAVGSTGAGQVTVRGSGERDVGALDRVLVVVAYEVPEMDYFSPKAMPFLKALVNRYLAASVPLNGLYADEMHIQQNWGYFSQHDEGQFTFRYLTPHLQRTFAASYGSEFSDLEKYLVYFCYGQHGFMPNLEARLAAQHVMAPGPEGVARAALLRRRYFDLLERTVTSLFSDAKRYTEERYGRALEARAHATWAQSPTIDLWTGSLPMPPRQYEYTPDFLWSNTVQQAASACSDYFAWNEFLTGGGNDHAEGGWLDRNYYGIALACSTGILNSVPYAYAAAWGMPHEVWLRHQAVCDAFGASASESFQSVEDAQHRDIEVLMLYPLSLVASEERFGSWMTQYAYANYVTGAKLLQHGRVNSGGYLEMAGRKFRVLVVLFEPFPPPELLSLIHDFTEVGGTVIWSGPPPRLDFAAQDAFAGWARLFGIKQPGYSIEGFALPGRTVTFEGRLQSVPAQPILTDFLVDRVYAVSPEDSASVVARVSDRVVGTFRSTAEGGSAAFLGFRPRDDQSASLGNEARTWFEVLRALSAYPGSSPESPDDNPSVVSRTSDYVACRFPNGTVSVAAHYRSIHENWPGGFHRDAEQDREIMARHPLPSPRLHLRDFRVAGQRVTHEGSMTVAFRLDDKKQLIAFAGHDCTAIEVGGRRYDLASAPLSTLAFAPAHASRRVEGGAALEIWAHGSARVSLPIPGDWTGGRLFLEGPHLGSAGQEVPCSVEESTLVFRAVPSWPRYHLFFVPSRQV